MTVRRFVREISSAWTRRLDEHPGLPLTDTRTQSTFSDVTTVGTRERGFYREQYHVDANF